MDDRRAYLSDVDAPPDSFEPVMGFERVEWRAGHARFRVRLAPHHRNRQGAVHGGIILALLDAAGMFAGNHEDGRGRAAVTVSMSGNFIAGTRDPVIYADGTLIRAGRSIYFASATVTDESGMVLATGQGAYKYR